MKETEGDPFIQHEQKIIRRIFRRIDRYGKISTERKIDFILKNGERIRTYAENNMRQMPKRA